MKEVKEILTISLLFLAFVSHAQKVNKTFPNLNDVMKGRVAVSVDSTSFVSQSRNTLFKPQKIGDLPLFCRMEELIFKKSKMNLRINLGSNDYVRKLEGK